MHQHCWKSTVTGLVELCWLLQEISSVRAYEWTVRKPLCGFASSWFSVYSSEPFFFHSVSYKVTQSSLPSQPCGCPAVIYACLSNSLPCSDIFFFCCFLICVQPLGPWSRPPSTDIFSLICSSTTRVGQVTTTSGWSQEKMTLLTLSLVWALLFSFSSSTIETSEKWFRYMWQWNFTNSAKKYGNLSQAVRCILTASCFSDISCSAVAQTPLSYSILHSHTKWVIPTLHCIFSDNPINTS